MTVVSAQVGLLAIGYWGVCHFEDDVAEFGWSEAVKTLAVSNNANTCHFYRGRRKQYAFFLWRKETHWTGFFSEEDDGMEHTVV